ncbi:MAG: hypothetical protein Q8P22_11605 [Chloroflexota bacterium]|nr:hypothetical protein [Chloroflexota bacterium]
MSDLFPASLSDLRSILGILGTTKTSVWPFHERTGLLVAGIGVGDLLPSETAGAAEALEDDFSPMLHKNGLYTYHFHPTGDHHFAGIDHNNYSFGTGLVDAPFSLGALILPNVVNDNTIMGKYDSAGSLEEYRWSIDANAKLSLELHDADASTKEIGASDTALAVGIPHFVVSTYDGGETDPVVLHYVDGAVDGAGATTETGAYVAMENLAAPLLVGAAGVTATPTTEFHGRIGLPFLTGKVLSAADVTALWNIYRHIFGL